MIYYFSYKIKYKNNSFFTPFFRIGRDDKIYLSMPGAETNKNRGLVKHKDSKLKASFLYGWVFLDRDFE